MVDDTARDRAIYHALKAADEVAAALQAHLVEEHGIIRSGRALRNARETVGVTSPWSRGALPCPTA
jgi:hypothetical protein